VPVSRPGNGELCVLGPHHPRNCGMEVLSPCNKRRADWGVRDEGGVHHEILQKAEGAAAGALLPPPPNPTTLSRFLFFLNQCVMGWWPSCGRGGSPESCSGLKASPTG
jgi:hypothetical protein